jgi:RNA polymerase sigma-70 factor (ECF subfamily)
LQVTQKLLGGIDGNAVEPGVKLGITAKLVQRPVSANKGFLGNVFDQIHVPHHAAHEPLYSTLVLDDQQTIGTLITGHRALHQFRGDAQFYTWLYRIAINTAKKFLGDLQRDRTVFGTDFKMDSEKDETYSPRNEPTTLETPESVLAAKEVAAAVNAALAALPEDLRQALTLREIEGLNYEEIADMMNCPIGTVRSRIFRAREAVSAKVKPMLEKQTDKRW